LITGKVVALLTVLHVMVTLLCQSQDKLNCPGMLQMTYW